MLSKRTGGSSVTDFFKIRPQRKSHMKSYIFLQSMRSHYIKPITLVTLLVILFLANLSMAANVTYTYDNLNRLIKVDYGNGKTEEFAYDAAGNRLSQNIVTETVSTPTTPSGLATGSIGTSYSYATGGSTSSLTHTVEYQFDWKGDGTDLSSWGSATQSKTWTSTGTYAVKARARCVTHNTIVSAWSGGFSVTITAAETVSTPTTPSGPATGSIGTSYSYATGGSASSLTHAVEYQFDWKGDGTDLSSWGSATQSKTWTSTGTYAVKARARCVTHNTIVSAWSGGFSVTITAAETVSTPTTPSGPATGSIGTSYSYTTGGSTSSLGHNDVDENWTDGWWNPSESGWGVNVIDQNDVLFIVLYLYGQDGKPVWYSVSAFPSGTNPSGYHIYQGDLYYTTGPWFGGPYNPQNVTYQKVGTLTFSPSTPDDAQLSYSVNGTNVSKRVGRFIFH
jgi:YD repeat-containing protein